ncbi:ubiquitin carboxyl-terminal hydrolase 16-like [Hibiscus syriacus]|uniref:ubiquitin carboxyl-terminal hydrolase 16-like n=1 Tax=Hibiscus syriacus TaxID=106335 RepID=UPI0019205CEE|nr:ubiquitin carboxyl-terminal hydrolase 16-like [Hibiscus syriacus]
MLLVGDLGFSSLVLVVSFVLPLIGFFVRRKWRLSVARQAEIQRLLILASEETARAELEATVGYGAVSISWNYHQCAVCYCPATTRCARCKAVRYCSPKCQIIYWRRGHKEECYPPPIVAHQIHDEGGDYVQKVIEQDQYGDGYENKGKLDAKLTRTSSKESALFNSKTGLALLSSSSSSAVLHGKDDDAKVELHADGEGLNSASESSSASFSGFSSSAAGSESSDDVSMCESISSNEPDKLDSSFSADANLDTFWTSSVVNNLDQTNPSSPKIVRLVDSGSIVEGSRLSSGFWDRTLKSVPSTNVADNESFNSYHKKGGKGASLDSGSSLHFSFTLSGNASSSHPHSSNVKDAKLDDAPQVANTSGHAKLSDGVTLSDNVGLDSLNVRNSKSSNSGWANQVECGSNNISHAAKPKEAISTDVPLVSFEKSGSTAFINGPSNASHTFKSSDAYSYNARVLVVSSVKSGKTNGVHAKCCEITSGFKF